MNPDSAEWSIQDLVRATGSTSRTLRHYGDIGLLTPSRVGANGYRFYDQDCLLRLQRIMLLRDLGLGLAAIAEVLDGQRDTAGALATHLALLEQERDRVLRRIASVRTTLRKTEKGEPLMAEDVFDGFDHTQYWDEVVERWGQDAYDNGDRWWRSQTEEGRWDFQHRQQGIAADYGRAHAGGLAADSDEVQAITRQHHAWVTEGWQGRSPDPEAFAGLGEMYVTDPRFAANYARHGEGVAEFVRDAMRVYAERQGQSLPGPSLPSAETNSLDVMGRENIG